MYNGVVCDVNKDSSPGYPWGLSYKTKEEAFIKAGEEIYDVVNYRLNSYLTEKFEFEGSSEAALSYVKDGFVDPIRLFIKNEPHAVEKISQGRYRLVCSVSMADELVERLLGGVQNNAEIDEWLTCPSKPGLGLSSDEQTSALYNQVKPWLDRGCVKENDVSGWDMNFKGWLYKADYYRRVSLAHGHEHAEWAKMLKGRFVCLARSILITSDGVVYSQTMDCLMKSGSYFTSSTNSAARVILATLLGADFAIAMGDDCVESNSMAPDMLSSLYYSYGFRIKEVIPCVDTFEFCSHTFYPDKAVPVNFWKGVFRLFTRSADELELAQFIHEYRHINRDLLSRVLSVLLVLPGWCGTKLTLENASD